MEVKISCKVLGGGGVFAGGSCKLTVPGVNLVGSPVRKPCGCRVLPLGVRPKSDPRAKPAGTTERPTREGRVGETVGRGGGGDYFSSSARSAAFISSGDMTYLLVVLLSTLPGKSP